jgi:hypothetical protein
VSKTEFEKDLKELDSSEKNSGRWAINVSEWPTLLKRNDVEPILRISRAAKNLSHHRPPASSNPNGAKSPKPRRCLFALVLPPVHEKRITVHSWICFPFLVVRHSSRVFEVKTAGDRGVFIQFLGRIINPLARSSWVMIVSDISWMEA